MHLYKIEYSHARRRRNYINLLLLHKTFLVKILDTVCKHRIAAQGYRNFEVYGKAHSTEPVPRSETP